MALSDRQENDIAAFYRATGELPPGISLSDPAFLSALNRVGGGGRGTNLNPAGGLDQNIINDFLSGFGQSNNRIDPVSDIIVPAATAVAFELNPTATLLGEAGAVTGTAAGHDIGGAQGATIGGIAGGITGGAAGGALSGGTAAAGSSAVDSGIAQTGTSAGAGVGGGLLGSASGGIGSAGDAGLTEAGSAVGTGVSGGLVGGSAGVFGGETTGLGDAARGAVGGVGGGIGPGSSLGTDPSTNQTVSGGATGSATSPGGQSIGTGSQAPVGGGTPLSQIAGDVTSAARLAGAVNNLANPPTPQGGTSVPQGPAEEAPIGGAVPASQIAASAPTAIPSGTFQSASDDFSRQQENTIRAQFANSNISGTPQEQRALQEANVAASHRSAAVQQAMTAAGISDQEVFTALLSSGLQPEQFQSAITQLRARGVV